MQKSLLFVLILLSAITTDSFSQVKTRTYFSVSDNKEFVSKRKPEKDYTIVIPLEFEQKKNKAAKDEVTANYVYKIAMPVQVDLDILKEAEIVKSKDTIQYLIKLKAPTVYSLSLHFSDFFLSENAKMFIYTDKEVTGPITQKQNNPDNFWATIPYKGEEITIEINVPKAEANKSRLIVSKVFLGYADISGEYFGSPGSSAACNRNVACPEGAGWDNERRSVATINLGGGSLATGVLIMNACGTNIPYLLTADHILGTNSTVGQYVFQFQYWSTDCATNTGYHDNIQYNGSQLRARHAESDFALLELNQIPNPNLEIFYAGWSRSSQPATSATGIHHPKGDLMKISRDINPVIPVSFFGGAADHWRAIFDQGIVQPGSSGSPLFDQNHRIVGQLSGDQNNACPTTNNPCFCTQTPIGEYGRFDFAWTGGGTNATRLSNWLDPGNTGAFTTNTTNISNLSTLITSFSIASYFGQDCSSVQMTASVPSNIAIT